MTPASGNPPFIPGLTDEDMARAASSPEEAAALAREIFQKRGFMCAESVLRAVCAHLGLDPGPGIRMATGFCSGLAHTSCQCGALSGAVLALSLALGRDQADDDYKECYARTRELVRLFTERFFSRHCTDLIAADLSTRKGRLIFATHKKKLHICLDLTEACVLMAIEALEGKAAKG